MTKYALELKTFIIYFLLCQVFVPLFIRGPHNAGNIGPISQWRLFSFSYKEYSKKIIDFPCVDSNKLLFRDYFPHSYLKDSNSQTPQEHFNFINSQRELPCQINSFKIFMGLPYQYFIESSELPVIKEGLLE